MPALDAKQLLDPEVIARAEMLGLQARKIVEGYLAGEHQSPFHGFAVEFTQHREYSPGDDTRHLDWKVLGRTDRTYIKQYEQETNFVAHLILDGSESMNYASGKIMKLDYAKQVAACLAYLILLQRDAVAVDVFDTQVHAQMPRTNNRAAIHDVLTTLAGFEARERTNIGATLHTMAQQIRRKGLAILISDCFDDEAKILQGIQHLRFAGQEVILFHVLDPAEIEFPFKGMVEFHGLEGMPKLITRPNEIRASYRREFDAFCARLRDGCMRNDTHYVRVNTAQPLAEVLSGYLAHRRRTAR